jgi:hypothetical protein
MLQRSCPCLIGGSSDFAVDRPDFRIESAAAGFTADALRGWWRRIRVKAFALPGIGAANTSLSPGAPPTVMPSGCNECGDLAERLHRLEEKLDRLLQLGLRGPPMPDWYAISEQRLLEAISAAGDKVMHLDAERGVLRKELADLAEGADRFLAGLKAQLSKLESDLFFELIATTQEGCNRRVRTYAEIGERLGISKQAVQKRFRVMADKHPSMAEYVRAIRDPAKPSNFSELSPSERRRQGVEESYGYDADG